MKAVQIHGYGGVEQLRYEDVATPEPGDGEVLVRVIATSVNPIDWKIRSGEAKDRFPVKFPFILGRDLAGEVVKAATGVTAFEKGQRVMGMVNNSYAEFLTAPADSLAIIPDGLAPEEAGALPLVLTTGAQLIEHINPKSGQKILVTGALGNVGRAAVFLAKHYGARVLAGVRANQKKEAESLGAAEVVAIDDERAIQALPELDAIADTVDGETIGKLLPKLKKGGILGSVLGKPAAAEGKDIYVEAFMAQPDADRLQQMARAVQEGEFQIPIAKRFKLKDAAEAQKFAEQASGGKVLLEP
ncbi:MAG TPA: NADP-dependent oxidoreductase [Bryobacteraceae bacterium]|nr:NADP-dependent oxidoreductase [Bryobacteraceae bacterium]